MELDNRNRQVDRWLDAAIKQYGTVEPHPDLEQDVLRRVRSAQKPSKPRLGWLVFAAAMVAVLVAGVLISNRRNDPQHVAIKKVMAPAVDEKKVAEAPRVSEQPRAASSGIRQRKARRPARESRAHSWPSQFPTPRPLSQQEQLLAQYVREQPQQAQFVAQARAELLRQTLAEFEARDRDKKMSSAFE